MSEGVREGARGHAVTSAATTEPVTQTKKERAADAVAVADRDLAEAERTADALAGISERDTWQEKRSAIDSAVKRVDLEIRRARQDDGDPRQLDKLHDRLAALEQRMTRVDAPAGFTALRLESEILAALRAKPEGGAATGNARKEATIDGLFRELDVTESLTLVSRLTKRVPGDALAEAFQKLLGERQV